MRIAGPVIDRLMALRPRLYVAATGAGAGIQSFLWERPGASCFLQGCSFPYSVEEAREFLGFSPAKAVCQKTAVQLAQAAFMRACRGPGGGEPLGLGLTAAVQTNRERRGEDQVFAACVTAGGTYVTSSKLFAGHTGYRHLQGLVCDEVGLSTLGSALGMEDLPNFAAMLPEGEERDILYEHPLFLPDGRRCQSAEGIDTIFPGSFNPLHDGHRGIMDVVSPFRKSVYSLTCDSVHKPPLSPSEILRRAAQFKYENHPLLITRNDALFILKARQFPGARMVMGADTLVRVLEPRWFEGVCPEYEDRGEVGVHEMLAEFRRLGTMFQVFDRTVDGKLLTLDDIRIDRQYRDMFRRIPKHWDISSTELREKAKGA